MAYTQENRLIRIDTPLGKDVLLLGAFRGLEGISMPFSYELDLVSENHSISFEAIIGKNVTVSLDLTDGEAHYFNGIISRFAQGRGGGEEGGDPRFSHYRAGMVPWFWLLTRTADSRIFQKLSVPDIVEKIFGEKSLSPYELQLDGAYEKREYCVQYRETDFNFISRLLEEEGIYYFFKQENGKHTMVIADAPSKHKPCPKQETAKYQLSAQGLLKEDVIMGLEKMQEIRPGKYSLNDFNFETPNTSLEANVPSKTKLGPGEREIYFYPGAYAKKSEGDRLARIRMEEEEAQITRIHGSSNCRAFASGYLFTLTDFYRPDMNDKKYVLTSIEHEANQDWEKESELVYSNHFTCIPFEVPYRPKRITPKPVVQGSQTAIVVGPQGEEIYTDKHSRVKVQFHWDREGKRDENSSCWIRVSEPWAGAGWGGMYIPRIGHEVIVDFLEGDPDRPIITGRVYHGNNKPPYPLPDEKTKSTLKSDSSLGGGGFNEIRFEDKKGEEQIYIHAEKNRDIVVKNDETHSVGNDRSKTIQRDETTEVKRDRTETVGRNEMITIVENRTEEVQKDEKVEVGQNRGHQVGKDDTLDVGKKLLITVGDQITIVTGNASILMKKSGDITIEGKNINIKGSGNIVLKATKILEN